MTEEQIVELPDAEESPAFDETERAAIAFATAMTQTEVVIDEALWSRVRAVFTDAQVVELAAAVAHENFRARFNHALGIEAQGFSEGAACAIPARRLPARSVAPEAAR